MRAKWCRQYVVKSKRRHENYTGMAYGSRQACACVQHIKGMATKAGTKVAGMHMVYKKVVGRPVEGKYM